VKRGELLVPNTGVGALLSTRTRVADAAAITSTDVLLKQLYYDPAVGLLSKAKFVAKLQRLHPEIRTAHVAAFVDR